MTLQAATNCWTKAGEIIAESLPQLSEFQAFVGASTSSEAALHVYQKSLQAPLRQEAFTLDDVDRLGAFAIVYSPTTGPYVRERTSSGFYAASGLVVVSYHRTAIPADSERGAVEQVAAHEDRVFENHVGNVMAALEPYVETNGGLRLLRQSVLEGTIRVRKSQQESLGNTQTAIVQINWSEAGP